MRGGEGSRRVLVILLIVRRCERFEEVLTTVAWSEDRPLALQCAWIHASLGPQDTFAPRPS